MRICRHSTLVATNADLHSQVAAIEGQLTSLGGRFAELEVGHLNTHTHRWNMTGRPVVSNNVRERNT